MKPEHKSVIDALRDEGYLVIIWTPEELCNVNIGHVEDRVTELGNEVIDNLAEKDGDDGAPNPATPATQDGAPE